MNRNQNNNEHRNRTTHAIGFSSVHPPGGLVAWPDGSTSKIGECREGRPMSRESFSARKGFVAWPEETPDTIRS